MRILSNLKSFFRRHTSILLAFLVVMLLILCPTIIGSFMGRYSEDSNEYYENQKAITFELRINNDLVREQNRLLKKNNVLLLNMIFDLNDFHEELKTKILYFILQDEEIE